MPRTRAGCRASSLCGTAVRGGLLLDLALAGRVESAEDSVVVDPTPTGFEPADRLLAAIAVEPERSLDGWMDERRIGLRDVVDANVASGRWQRRSGRRSAFESALRRPAPGADRERDRRRRLPTTTPTRTLVADRRLRDRDAAAAAADGGSPLTRSRELQDVELWAPGRRPDELLSATGPVAWLAGAVVDHVLVTGARYRAQAGALGAGGLGPF